MGSPKNGSRRRKTKMADNQVMVLKQKAQETIDQLSAELYSLNQRILKNPELSFKETYAHGQLTEFFAANGFDVTPHYTLDTAFRAETGEDGGLKVGLICEYDALPEVGHACGHNLIAESGVAAALGKLGHHTEDYNHYGRNKFVEEDLPCLGVHRGHPLSHRHYR